MAQPAAEKEAAAAAKLAEKEAVAAAKAARTEATVMWLGNSRTYTREIHGEDFEQLAKEFAAKKNGTVV
jgi:hypothetical protein